jgi:hypothetical protein
MKTLHFNRKQITNLIAEAKKADLPEIVESLQEDLEMLKKAKKIVVYHPINYTGTLYKAEATPEKLEILKQYNGITFVIDRIVTE